MNAEFVCPFFLNQEGLCQAKCCSSYTLLSTNSHRMWPPATPGHQMEELSDPCLPSSSAPCQLLAAGRSVLPKCFSEKVPISLSMDQPTIAFSESQIHQILRIISDETVLWETRNCSRRPVRRGSRTPKRTSECSGRTDGYSTLLGFSTTQISDVNTIAKPVAATSMPLRLIEQHELLKKLLQVQVTVAQIINP